MGHVMKNTAAAEGCEKLYLNENYADVHFLFNVNDDIQKVPANKIILAVLSPILNAMFFGSLKKKDEVLITNADIDGFKEFLQFFYRGEVALSTEHIETVIRMADKYDILNRVKECVTLLRSQLTPDNVCWGYQLAVLCKNDKLTKICEDQITKYPKKVFATNGFESCGKDILGRILKLDLRCVEIDIFDACLAWAKCACKEDGVDETDAVNLIAKLGDYLKLIRFGSMRSDEFLERYMLHKDLFTSEEFKDIMLSLSVKQYEPNIFNRAPKRYMWDAKQVLRCKRTTPRSKNSPKKYVKISELTSFSSNQNVLLGEFNTAIIFASSGDLLSVASEVEVTIIQREDRTLQSNASSNVLYKGTSKTWSRSRIPFFVVTLPQPILIQPQYIYDIQLIFPATDGCYYFSDCKQTVKMAFGNEIQFHRNPTLDYDNQTESCINELFFNSFF